MTNSFKTKRILAATLAAIMLTMGAAFAEEAETKEEIMLISEEAAEEKKEAKRFKPTRGWCELP